MLNIFHTNWLTALRGNRQRTVAPLRKFKRGRQLEPAEVETLVQEICAHDDCESSELDEVDALVQEVLDHDKTLPTGSTAGPQPIPVGASVWPVVEGRRGHAKRGLLN